MSKTVQLQLSRLLPASVDEVFDLWLEPESLKRWMRPGDADAAYVEVHPVVGGTFRIDMHGPDGRLHTHTGQYLEIRRPDKLKFTWQSSVLGEHSSQVTVEFYEQSGQCLMVLTHELPSDADIVENHRQGWTTILDALVQHQRAKQL